MNREIEEEFVKRFIAREKRKRVLYELTSPKKRDHAIEQMVRYLDDKYFVFNKAKNVNDNEFLSLVKQYVDITKQCYVIGDCKKDGCIVPFMDAFNDIVDSGMVYLIISLDMKTVIAKDEDSIGCSPSKMILRRND